ncbi:hypothetical protein CYY_009047 [Polysphondylium violaceum]|uniref:Actin-binding transcription modulator n=1 Tax=Polysphondylium violaceum TaxID=133409 RepID=A0A8J4UWF3_9MYCE|nr:hypothetical protein CYY_009047 [Polysphondylium violaceum]
MRTVIERYYTQHFVYGKEDLEDQYVNQHSNGLCIIGIAPSHPVLTKEIVKIDFRENLLNNEVQGTRKKGGFRLQKDTIICEISCSDSTTYSLRSCIKGKLLEVNKLLLTQPSLLKSHTSTSGYLAVIDPMIKEEFFDNVGMVSYEDYHNHRNIPMTKGPVFLKDSSFEE